MAFYVDLGRFEEQIRAYERNAPLRGGLLLYGSSFFANWGDERARAQMGAASGGRLRVVNRGFGGATADELLYYYDRLVRPCAPGAAAFRMGPNDLFQGLSVAEAWVQSWRVLEWFRRDFPGIPLLPLTIFDFPSPALAHWRPQFCAYNALLLDYAAKTEGVTALDIGPFFYEDPACAGTFEHFRDVFLPDGLHLTDIGYEKFAAYFARLLEMLLP